METYRPRFVPESIRVDFSENAVIALAVFATKTASGVERSFISRRDHALSAQTHLMGRSHLSGANIIISIIQRCGGNQSRKSHLA